MKSLGKPNYSKVANTLDNILQFAIKTIIAEQASRGITELAISANEHSPKFVDKILGILRDMQDNAQIEITSKSETSWQITVRTSGNNDDLFLLKKASLDTFTGDINNDLSALLSNALQDDKIKQVIIKAFQESLEKR